MTTANTIRRIAAPLLILLAAGTAHTQEASSNTIYIQDTLAEVQAAAGLEDVDFDLEALPNQVNTGDVVADLTLATVDASKTTATAAAIGNSLTVDSPSNLLLVGSQTNEVGSVGASLSLDSTHATDILEGTAAAIANSVSANSEDLALIRLQQESLGTAVSAFQETESSFGGADVELTAAGIANSATLEINGELDLEALQVNEAIVEAESIVGLARAGDFTTVTSAAMGNSLSVLVSAGNLVGESIQVHDAGSVSAGVDISSRHGAHDLSDVSLTAAAIANSLNINTSIDVDPELSFLIRQNSTGNVSSWLKADGPNMSGSGSMNPGISDEATGAVTATAAAIGNSATIDVSSPVRVK